jgi:hypothetical protein
VIAYSIQQLVEDHRYPLDQRMQIAGQHPPAARADPETLRHQN